MTISLENVIAPERVVLLKAADKDGVLKEMGAVLATAPDVTDPEALVGAIFEREQIMSTGIGLVSPFPTPRSRP